MHEEISAVFPKIDGQVGEIFVMKPVFSNTNTVNDISPVTAGKGSEVANES